MMRLRLALPLTALAAAGLLVGWNASRFVGAEARIRTKELDFLPSPLAARLGCAGHANTVAKLRWIDSFAYFQLIVDRKDDTVRATGESAYERLFEMLVGLDPHFIPYYSNASLNVGAVLGRQGKVATLLLRGILDNPHETALWRQLAALYHTEFRLEERNPATMNALLDEWAAHETTEERIQQVWDWKQSMARRTFRGLEQVPYWLEQLGHAKPGTPAHDFITATLREQLARWGEQELTALGARPGPDGALAADPAAVAARWPQGAPAIAPVRLQGGRAVVREDPFGHVYRWQDGAVASRGLALSKARHRARYLTGDLATAAARDGRWAATLAELALQGVTIPDPPPGCAWRVAGREVVLDHEPAIATPWTFDR